MSVEQKIIEILAEQALLLPSDLNMDMNLTDIGLDSMGLVETVFAIEEEFDISVPFNANDPAGSDFDVSTVRSIVDGVVALRAAQG